MLQVNFGLFLLSELFIFLLPFPVLKKKNFEKKKYLLAKVKDDNPMLVKAMYTHYDFGGFPFRNDLVLLELQKPIEVVLFRTPFSCAGVNDYNESPTWGTVFSTCVRRGVGDHLCILHSKGC